MHIRSLPNCILNYTRFEDIIIFFPDSIKTKITCNYFSVLNSSDNKYTLFISRWVWTRRRPSYKFPYLPPLSHKLFAFCVHWIFIHQMPLMGNVPHYFWIIYDSWAWSFFSLERTLSISFENGFGGSGKIKKNTKMICHGKRYSKEKSDLFMRRVMKTKDCKVELGTLRLTFLWHTTKFSPKKFNWKRIDFPLSNLTKMSARKCF